MPETPPYRRILALVELNGNDAALLGQARLLARLCGARLDLLHLVDLPPDGEGYPQADRAQAARTYEAEATRRMAFHAGRHGIGPDACHARHGPAAQGFRAFVRDQAPDLVIVPRHLAELASGPWDVLALGRKSPCTGRGLLARLRGWLTIAPAPSRA